MGLPFEVIESLNEAEAAIYIEEWSKMKSGNVESGRKVVVRKKTT